MATRSPQSQATHDKVVRDIAASTRYLAKLGRVGTNPGSEKNYRVDGEYPDIVVLEYGTGTPVEIGEVETEDSITETEAWLQWVGYGRLGPPFDLFVPAITYSKARDIVQKSGVKLREIVLYNYEQGKIKLT